MSWFRHLFSRTKIYDDLSEEVAQHIDERTDELLQSGLTRQQASAQARREFGNVTSLKEEGRETWQWPRLESFLSDIRYAFRQLRRNPTFAIVAVLILGIGIGANTAVFSVMDTLLVRPLPFPGADRLTLVINFDRPELSYRASRVSTYEGLTEMESFEDITTYEAFFSRSSYKLTGDREPDRVMGVMVPSNFFPFLGVNPLLGRTFTEEECALNGPGAVLLSHALWQRRYSSDPGVIGRQIVVNDRPATVVGVLPASFNFGAVFAPGMEIDLFLPAVFDELREWENTMAIIGRLKPGVTLEAAQTEATMIAKRLELEHPEFAPPGTQNARLLPFRESLLGEMQRPVLTLWAAVGLVLLIVCVNLSNLLLARATTRRKEMALRGALGAGRGRLARQLLTESCVLSLLGGGLGILLAYGATAYVKNIEGLTIPLLKTVTINQEALAATLGITFLTALLIGLAPALAVLRGDLQAGLKDSSRSAGGGREQRWAQSFLVVSEIALACLLLIGAGLLLRSFLHVLDVDLGFKTEQTYALRIDPGEDIEGGYNFVVYINQILSATRATPGVASASITDAMPLERNRSWWYRAEGQPIDPDRSGIVKIIGPGLLKTMGTRLIAGREFDEGDQYGKPLVALVNQTLAEGLWPGQNPIGQTLHLNDAWQVVGVVEDVRHISVEKASGAEFYLPITQNPSDSIDLVVRTDRPFADVAPRLRTALAKVIPDLPTAGFRPLDQIVERAISPRRFFVEVLTSFAAAALLLAAIGIYGIVSYSVSRRTPEIGIRMALGASRSRVRASVLASALRLALMGIALGAAGAGVLSSLLSSLLFDVSVRDPWTFGIAAAALLFTATFAGFLPAARASRISPISALRAD